MQFNLYRTLRWWRQAGRNGHLGGSFNLELYLAVFEAKVNQLK